MDAFGGAAEVQFFCHRNEVPKVPQLDQVNQSKLEAIKTGLRQQLTVPDADTIRRNHKTTITSGMLCMPLT